MPARSFAVIAALLTVGATPAAAGSLGDIARDDACRGSTLTTCASSNVRFAQLGSELPPALLVGVHNILVPDATRPTHAIRFNPLPGQVAVNSAGGPQILAIYWGDDGRVTECRPGGLDCRNVEDPTTVAPEPVTMTLLATGLVGLAGAGLRRRRKNIGDTV